MVALGSRFRQLLAQLAEEHDNEISVLRLQLKNVLYGDIRYCDIEDAVRTPQVSHRANEQKLQVVLPYMGAIQETQRERYYGGTQGMEGRPMTPPASSVIASSQPCPKPGNGQWKAPSSSKPSSNVIASTHVRSPFVAPGGDDDTFQRQQCLEEKEEMQISERPHLAPKANDDDILSAKAQSSLNTLPKYDTNMHWALDTKTPEEEDAQDLANDLAKWRVIKFFGLNTDRLAHMILSWWGYREPTRKNTCLLRFVESKHYQFLTLTVIFLNILCIVWITNDDITNVVEDPTKSAHRGALDARFWADCSFSAFYVLDLLVRLYLHRQFLFVSIDWGWNLFDVFLVVLSIFDISMSLVTAESAHERPNLTFLRVLRILRVARVLRMVRAVRWVQELRLMLDCVLHSAFHLFWCIILILSVLLIFALLLVQGVTEHLANHRDDPAAFETELEIVRGTFDTVPHAMLSLFEAVSGGGDWGDYYRIVQRAGTFYDVMFLFYVAFFAIVAWNIVMSTFVEKAMNLAAPDIDTMILEKRRKDLHYAKELTAILEECMDEDGNHIIGYDEFKQHMGDEKVKHFFQARDLDMKDAELFFRMLASLEDAHGHVDMRTFVMGCMQLRGMASNIDVQSLHYEMKNMFRHSREELQSLIATLSENLAPGHDGVLPKKTPNAVVTSRLENVGQFFTKPGCDGEENRITDISTPGRSYRSGNLTGRSYLSFDI